MLQRKTKYKYFSKPLFNKRLLFWKIVQLQNNSKYCKAKIPYKSLFCDDIKDTTFIFLLRFLFMSKRP